MQGNSPSKGLTAFLLIASIAIWGIIGARVYGSLEMLPEENMIDNNEELSLLNDQTIGITADEFQSRLIKLRNPFQPKAQRVLKSKQGDKLPVTRQGSSSKIGYIGFVDAIDGRVAILSNQEQATRLCMVGDTAYSIRIVKIEPEQVIVLQEGQHKSISLRHLQQGK